MSVLVLEVVNYVLVYIICQTKIHSIEHLELIVGFADVSSLYLGHSDFIDLTDPI